MMVMDDGRRENEINGRYDPYYSFTDEESDIYVDAGPSPGREDEILFKEEIYPASGDVFDEVESSPDEVPEEQAGGFSADFDLQGSEEGESPVRPSNSVESVKLKKKRMKRKKRIERRKKRKGWLRKVRRIILVLLLVAGLCCAVSYLFFSSALFMVSEVPVNHNTLKSDKRIIKESGIRIGETYDRREQKQNRACPPQ